MKKTLISITSILLLGSSVSAFAGNTHDPRVNVRQEIQELRIKQGVRSGELTKAETQSLVRQQKRINKLERAYKSDGHLTLGERRNLAKAQNKASKDIYRKKHNPRKRF